MTGHTPGPWRVGEFGANRVVFSDDLRVAVVQHLGSIEDRANAMLVAAAPRLLEVLLELQESAAYWSDYDVPLGIAGRINDAIELATGEKL